MHSCGAVRRSGGRRKPPNRKGAIIWEDPIERDDGSVLLNGMCSQCLRLAVHGVEVEGKKGDNVSGDVTNVLDSKMSKKLLKAIEEQQVIIVDN